MVKASSAGQGSFVFSKEAPVSGFFSRVMALGALAVRDLFPPLPTPDVHLSGGRSPSPALLDGLLPMYCAVPIPRNFLALRGTLALTAKIFLMLCILKLFNDLHFET